MTITEFLLARIAEDEAEARDDDGTPTPVGMWDPDRVLTECEAKRRIVERLSAVLDPFATEVCTAEAEQADDILCALAEVYADHEDFDPVWQVSTR